MKRAKEKTTFVPINDRQLLSIDQVCAFLSISIVALHRVRNDPDEKFPRPLSIIGGKPLWALVDITAYVDRKRKEVASLARA